MNHTADQIRPPQAFSLLFLFLALFASSAQAAPFLPDPRTVQWHGPAYRYPQAGWVVVHIEGEPYPRGVQHGRLLAVEIAGHVQSLAESYGAKAPTEAWNAIRNKVKAFLLRGFTEEQQEEMRGIAEGASAAGARFDDRPLDLLDIAAINCANELDALDSALENIPTASENLTHPRAHKAGGENKPGQKRQERPQRCSAFAANGPATKDGQIVFGHITMYDLYPGNFYNIWLEIQPSQGHRAVLQTMPGGIHSGMDYSISDSGLLLCETTLEQAAFDVTGIPLAARIRSAMQYAETIEEAAAILSKDGNGLCTTEWIMADFKKNEIALLTLASPKSKLYRGSQREWIAGAENFYWSCNNAKDSEVMMAGIASAASRPTTMGTFAPSKRDALWLRIYEQHKGRIDLDFARLALTTPAMVSAFAVDAKYTNSELARQFTSWATFGPPVGGIRPPSYSERQKYSLIKPLVSNPWTVLHPTPPAQKEENILASDLHDPENPLIPPPPSKVGELEPRPAWHGTLLAASDGDIWLTTAFAHYERIVALEHKLRENAKGEELKANDWDELGVEVAYFRSLYEQGARSGNDLPLAKILATPREENWHKIASGKGVLVLHSLRGLLGGEIFDRLLLEFGQQHAGEKVSSAAFQRHCEEGSGQDLSAFFSAWLGQPGLPRLSLGKSSTRRDGNRWLTTVTVSRPEDSPPLAVPITVETKRGEVLASLALRQTHATTEIVTDEPPLRVVVDKHGLTARANGEPFTILSFDTELEETIIAYGTLDEESANHEAALLLQPSLRRREHNITVPIRQDREVTEEELKNHHVILIGRPNSNLLVKRFEKLLPVTFGPHSFAVRGTTYAHPESAAIMVAENPLNRRYSLVTVAGLSGLATVRLAPEFENDTFAYAQVVVLPYNQEEENFLVAPAELTRELSPEP